MASKHDAALGATQLSPDKAVIAVAAARHPRRLSSKSRSPTSRTCCFWIQVWGTA